LILVHFVKAEAVFPTAWLVYWQENPNYDYTNAPYNMSTKVTISGTDCTVTASIAISVYTYNSDSPPLDEVCFRVSVFIDSITIPGGYPRYASGINIYVDKDGDRSDLANHRITMLVGPANLGRSQGCYLDQTTYQSTNYEQRYCEAAVALATAVISALDPTGVVSVISTLISFGSTWLPTSGADYCDVGPYDLSAFSYWEGQIPGSENPLREYCFNEFHWDVSSNAPQSYYGLKIWAYVYLNGPVGDVQAFWLGPLYLQIVNPHPSGGGGGCPMLSVFN